MPDSHVIHKAEAVQFFFGELILKGRNRHVFESRFEKGVAASLRGMHVSSIFRSHGRVVAVFPSAPPREELMRRASRVFGAAAFAPCVFAGVDKEDIGRAVLSGLEGRKFSTYAVRSRRSDNVVKVPSMEMNICIGDLVGENYPDARVNLDEPEQTIYIDMLRDGTIVYFDKFRGAGGLPPGTGGRVACMISGGIDSPVAAWMMARRGCEPVFIHFHSAPFTDSRSQEKVEDIIGILEEWVGDCKVYMVPFGELQKKLVTNIPAAYRVLMYRRFMVRIAEVIARRERCEALITGESLGQVASQTLTNIVCVTEAATIPILRPLIGMDKREITDFSRQIGTYDLSIEPHMDCCSFLEPPNPQTRANARDIYDIEDKLDVKGMVAEAVTNIKKD